MKRIAIDNNVLVKLVGIDKTYRVYQNYNYSLDEAIFMMLLSKNKRNNFNSLIQLYKKILQKEIRLVILPTVLKEAFDKEKFNKVAFRKTNLNVFLHDYNVEHVIFENTENYLINELTNVFVSQENPVFILNKNKDNQKNDAKIMAEACFANVDIITLDKHFKDKNAIQEVLLKFYEEKKGQGFNISKNIQFSKPITPNKFINSFSEKSRNF